MARMLGKPLLPWQQHVADVAGELLSDGKPAYRYIVVMVPRQSGKTTLLLAWEADRALSWPTQPQRIVYTAQTGQDARKKLIIDQVPILRRSRNVAPLIDRVYTAAGSEAVVFVNGSRIEALPTTEDAGHGATISLAVMDEIWHDVDSRRDQALMPAARTIRDGQLVYASTAGTQASTFLMEKVQGGRALADAGVNTGTAYFEWSADPSDDPDDPEVWWDTMPALGYTTDEDTIRSERQVLTDADFRRSSLNQFTAGDERAIPQPIWDAVQLPGGSAEKAGAVFGFDVAWDRTCAAVVACDAAGVVELVEYRPGIEWVVPRVRELCEKYKGSTAADVAGPAGGCVDDLTRLGVRVEKYVTRRLTYACGRMWDALLERRVHFRPDGNFDAAASAAQKRPVGDAWVWLRSGADLSPLIAATVAFDMATAPAEARPRPWIL